MQYVYVLNKHGEPLMPCSPGKARLLLKQQKAHVIKRTPFTIKRSLLPTMKSLTFIANILTSCFELLISKSLKKTPLANAILVCTSFAPVTRKPSLTEAVSRFATAIMSRPSRKGRNTKFLILLTATVSPMN